MYALQPNLQEMIPRVPKFRFIYLDEFWHFDRPTSPFDAPYQSKDFGAGCEVNSKCLKL
jgi:hypothetical protein